MWIRKSPAEIGTVSGGGSFSAGAWGGALGDAGSGFGDFGAGGWESGTILVDASGVAVGGGGGGGFYIAFAQR
jgi:hypothetical protein